MDGPKHKYFLLTSLTPWLLLSFAYLEAIVAWHTLGHWPRPMLDDPKHIPTGFLHIFFQLLLVGIVPLALLFISVTAINWSAIRLRSIYSLSWVVFISGLLTLWVLLRTDPGNVWYWLFD